LTTRLRVGEDIQLVGGSGDQGMPIGGFEPVGVDVAAHQRYLGSAVFRFDQHVYQILP
jgi:hypothetical protein